MNREKKGKRPTIRMHCMQHLSAASPRPETVPFRMLVYRLRRATAAVRCIVRLQASVARSISFLSRRRTLCTHACRSCHCHTPAPLPAASGLLYGVSRQSFTFQHVLHVRCTGLCAVSVRSVTFLTPPRPFFFRGDDFIASAG